jgi:hypothetical protein
MKMLTYNSDDLSKLGTALYGPRWMGPMAHALGISASYLAKITRDERPIPPALLHDVERLVHERLTLTERLHAKLMDVVFAGRSKNV